MCELRFATPLRRLQRTAPTGVVHLGDSRLQTEADRTSMKTGSNDRWASYVQVTGDALVTFLQDHAATRNNSRKVCLILGKGFDPRMLAGFKALCQVFPPVEI